jgi:hypothetical protein
MTTQTMQKVDHSALKANQLTIITLNILAFIFNLPILAAFVAIVMGIGAALKLPGFILLYRYFYKPLGLLKPDVLDDNPELSQFIWARQSSAGDWSGWWLPSPHSMPSAVSASAAQSTTGSRASISQALARLHPLEFSRA